MSYTGLLERVWKALRLLPNMVMDQRTIKKYLSMSEQEYLEYQGSLSYRLKKLKPYEDFVRERLEACQEASAAQVHDWLKECHSDFRKLNHSSQLLLHRQSNRCPGIFFLGPGKLEILPPWQKDNGWAIEVWLLIYKWLIHWRPE